MTIDDFKRWKVDALKDYLRQRGLGVSGNKETLVARAFVAWELKLPKVLTPQEYRDNVKKDFSSLLATPGGDVPDPKTLSDWMDEDQGMPSWPPTMIQDIGVYLGRLEPFRNEGPKFTNRLPSDYKDQKAYSYFSSRWLLKIHYHPISDDSPYCFLKAQCTPSQRISQPPHVWVLLHKNSGYIHSAFCTFFAG